MQVLVVGATGILGRHVFPRLLERGHGVRVTVRNPENLNPLRRLGVEAVSGDILHLESMRRAAVDCDAVLHLATLIPRAGAAPDWGPNDRIRREGTANLLDAALRTGCRHYIQQSITFIYGEQGDRLAGEQTPLQPVPHIQSAVDMEEQVRAADLPWCILRGGAFYGPGTGKEDGWRQQALAGSLRLPGDGSALLSLIHVVDMARAIVAALEQAPPGSTYNVVDDCPVSYRELYQQVTAQLGTLPPEPGGHPVPSLGVSNAAIKAALGWAPAFPSYRSGLVAPITAA